VQLKRLEAYGFKSFAERIVVQFDQGITAVVGPNGSGKSNITDAVRWVLGEQNIRMLRGLRAEDIIFAGSSARRALSVAEVILVFDNTDKTLPIDYEEVVVKRRLYRNGDSEIYLNDSRCRIKDIYQLFADTGIGHDGMSIIGQNRLNDILDSRPEDRRGFFEETAGITKYRTRKQEALRKLRDNDADLVRLSDIMHAQAAELQPLSQQAEKTKQYRALDSERRSYQLTALVQQHESLQKEQESLDKEYGTGASSEAEGKESEEASDKKSAETDVKESEKGEGAYPYDDYPYDPKEDRGKVNLDKPDIVVGDKHYATQINDWYMNFQDYEGKTVSIDGYYMNFGGYTLVGRMGPSCPYCTGGYVNFEFKTDLDLSKLKSEESWIRVKGILRKGKYSISKDVSQLIYYIEALEVEELPEVGVDTVTD